MVLGAKSYPAVEKREEGEEATWPQRVSRGGIWTPPTRPGRSRTEKVGVVALGDFTASRLVLEPGWRWSENVKPIAGTDSGQVLHTGYHVSGRLHVRLDDGTEEEFGPGDAYVIPPGHDAWVVGHEPVVSVDMSSVTAEHYAKEG